jgi:hypothetical protein
MKASSRSLCAKVRDTDRIADHIDYRMECIVVELFEDVMHIVYSVAKSAFSGSIQYGPNLPYFIDDM